MPSSHHGFTVHDEDSDLVLACAATHDIINAAWHAAVRTTPKTNLALKNGAHVMERMLTPGNKSVASVSGHGKAYDARLQDLREWHRLRLFCEACRHNVHAEAAAMIRQHGRNATIIGLEKRMRCRKCGSHHVRLEICNQPR